MVGGGINDWKFFLFVGVVDGCVYFILFYFYFFILWPLVVLTMVGFEFVVDGGDGLGRI